MQFEICLVCVDQRASLQICCHRSPDQENLWIFGSLSFQRCHQGDEASSTVCCVSCLCVMSILEKLSEKSLFCVKRHCSDVLDVQVIWVGNRPSSSSACRVRSTSCISYTFYVLHACVLRFDVHLRSTFFEVSSTLRLRSFFNVLRSSTCSGVLRVLFWRCRRRSSSRWQLMVGWVGA